VKEWRNFASVYGKLRPPLRPSPSDVANIREGIAGSDRRVLLLGVTPELSVLGEELVAVDNSPRMIARAWPGDDERRRALLADWTDLPFEDSAFDAAIGDGSLNSAPGQVEPVLREVKRVMRPGGRATFRIFSSPEDPEDMQSIHSDVGAGRCGNLHALKWRIAMTIAAAMEHATVPVRSILEAFDDMFPDRSMLAAKTGWSLDEIATLDAYDGADHSLSFPTLPQLLEMGAPFFARAHVIENKGYPLAERCPTIVWGAD
jgi:SAM-dependent methyltransferase